MLQQRQRFRRLMTMLEGHRRIAIALLVPLPRSLRLVARFKLTSEQEKAQPR
ncbi:hypothetical protein PC116_g20846 [Phytophthora cactorum]|nr:hypothetical protein PC128_g12378 [Phytophthora cactorum]KAG4230872.1 hypothetical protein PC116_g20846 [Phytophthora cactorum]